jgi:alpha/beta superfamily hydrolase
VTSEPLVFASADGLALEGELDRRGHPRAALVMCHPHPNMGGTMNAPLLRAVRDHLIERDWAVLRFNFRGIGASEGTPGIGVDETADAEGAVAELRSRLPGLPVVLAGWSFGGAVAVRAAERDDSLAGCAAIAPAVRARSEVTAGLPPAAELDLGVPLLFVCGANDDVVPPEACKEWIDAVPAGRYVEIAGANHFFWGRYEKLCAVIGQWLEDVV